MTDNAIATVPKGQYSVIVFFDSQNPKKWAYVHKLNVFALFLNGKHPEWLYFNVYDRQKGVFLKRFYKKDYVPAFL